MEGASGSDCGSGSGGRGAVLVLALFARGRGAGHLIRGASLVRDLHAAGREAFLCIEGDRSVEEALHAAGEGLRGSIIERAEIASRCWDFIVTDLFAVPEAEFERLRPLAPIIGIDEGGAARPLFDFLFDLLPQSRSKCPPNMLSPAFNKLPVMRKKEPFAIYGGAARRGSAARGGCAAREVGGKLKVLIVFGMENSKDLTAPAKAALEGLDLELTAIEGFKDIIPNLRDRLFEFDLLITHFGLCAFESIYAGTPVALISPSAYHAELSKAAGFFHLGIGKRGVRRLRKALPLLNKIAGTARAVAARYGLEKPQDESLGAFLSRLTISAPRLCPLCKAQTRGRLDGKSHGVAHIGHIIERFNDKTYKI